MATICHLLFCAVIAAVFTNALSKTTDYCNLKSCKRPHTMCVYKSNLPASTCVNLKDRGLTDNEKDIIVKKHNELRQRVAAGLEKRGNPGPQPPAVNMPNLSWDNELETIAQRWADQCTFAHDQCRNVERFPVGQNIAITMSSGENKSPVEGMVQAWYNEVKDMDNRQVEKITNFTKVGHYTQVVWAATTKIGCGRVKYRGGRWNNQLLVCNYGPAGNYVRGKVYEVKK